MATASAAARSATLSAAGLSDVVDSQFGGAGRGRPLRALEAAPPRQKVPPPCSTRGTGVYPLQLARCRRRGRGVGGVRSPLQAALRIVLTSLWSLLYIIKQINMEKVALIDGDSLLYYEMGKPTLEEAMEGLDIRIRQILNFAEVTSYAGFLTLSKCFRYDIAKTRPYKYNRKGGAPKPPIFYALKEYIQQELDDWA